MNKMSCGFDNLQGFHTSSMRFDILKVNTAFCVLYFDNCIKIFTNKGLIKDLLREIIALNPNKGVYAFLRIYVTKFVYLI